MIFFGTKGRIVDGTELNGHTCPACGGSHFRTFGVLNYFHIYWIPTFLKSKQAGMECANCRQTLLGDEIPSHLAEQVRSGLFTTGRILPMFSGAILIGLMVLTGIYYDRQFEAQEAAYIAAPAVNDYYVVDFTKIFVEADPEYKYGVMRVTDVDGQQVAMQVSDIAYDRASGASKDVREGKAAAAEYYSNETVYFDHGELLELRDDGAIHSIKR